MIPPPLLPSVNMENFEHYNDDDERDIYKNNKVPNHDYRVKDRSLLGIGAGEGGSPALGRGSNICILEGRKCVTHDGGDDDNDIYKSNGFPTSLPHGTTTG